MKHSTIMGGSSAARRIHCPGSYALEQSLPEERGEESAYADEGKMLHFVVEECANNGWKPDRFLSMGLEGFTADHVVLVQTALDAFYAFAEQFRDFEFVTELRVTLEAIGLEGCWGHTDVAFAGTRISDGVRVCGVLDWKFGHGVAVDASDEGADEDDPAKGNVQLAFYLLGLTVSDDPDCIALWRRAEDFILAVCQPSRSDMLDYWTTDAGWLDRFGSVLVDAYAKLRQPDAPLNTGSHCQFCPALLACPAQTADAERALVVEPSKLTVVELAYWLEKAPQVQRFINKMLDHAHQEAEAGVEIPGYKLVEKHAQRKHADEAKVRALAYRAGLSVEDVETPRALLSPNQLELAVKRKLGAKKAKPLIAELQQLQTKQSSGTKIVPLSNKAPAVDVNVSSKWGALLEET